MNKRELGRFGEELAEKFLEKNGIKILNKNYFTNYGEIDLIGIENETIIFIEVKLRTNNSYGEPSESINFKKKQNLLNAIDIFLAENDFSDYNLRIDIICILYNISNEKYEVRWLKNQYFDVKTL